MNFHTIKLCSIPSQSYLFLPKCLMHFKFNKTMHEKQVKFLKNFETDIEKTMEKLKKNQKVKLNRKTKLFSKIMLSMDQQKQVSAQETTNFSAGSPEELVVRRDGMSKSFLTSRMKVLNINFTRAVSEIFVTDQELIEKCDQLKIRLTQVRAASNCKAINIYWINEDASIDKQIVADYLNSIKSKLRELLKETQYMNSVPWISFVYDLQANYQQDLNEKFKKIETQVLSTKENAATSNEIGGLKNKISFEKPLEGIANENYHLKNNFFEYKSEDVYKYLKLRLPTDMDLNACNLDYENIMNKVLKNMNKFRRVKTANDSMSNCYAVDEVLLPLDGTQTHNYKEVEYNTEERINAIKKFVKMRQKDKNKAELKLKRQIMMEEVERTSSYEELKNILEAKLTLQ